MAVQGERFSTTSGSVYRTRDQQSSVYSHVHGASHDASGDPTLSQIREVVNMDVDLPNIHSLGPSYYVVIDTNILLSYLDVIQQFTDDVEKLQLAVVVVIPGVVVQELDYQKSSAKSDISWSSRRASTWILKKLKERKSVKGQAYGETCQQSGKWSVRDKGQRNDSMILDCCRYFSLKHGKRAVFISNDKNLLAEAESNNVPNVDTGAKNIKWSSKDVAKAVFGEDFTQIHLFTDFLLPYGQRPRHTRQIETLDPDGMDIDVDASNGTHIAELAFSHPLDELHCQIIDHFTTLLLNLIRRVAPHLFATNHGSTSGAAASIHAPDSRPPPVTAAECVEYLGSTRSKFFPRLATSDIKDHISAGATRLRDFMLKPYQGRGRAGHTWARADWDSCLVVLKMIGDAWGEILIAESLERLAPHLTYLFQTRMVPTGMGL